MKRILYIIPAMLLLVAVVTSCNDKAEQIWKEYAETRQANVAFYNEQAEMLDENGQKYYSKIVPAWDLNSEILMHYFNDRTETEGNLSPMLTSRCAISYKGWNSQGVAFDSSYTATSRVSYFRPKDTITGWWIALENMRVGDSCRVVLPYNVAYGSSGTTSGAIGPFETLIFDIKLVDIAEYSIK